MPFVLPRIVAPDGTSTPCAEPSSRPTAAARQIAAPPKRIGRHIVLPFSSLNRTSRERRSAAVGVGYETSLVTALLRVPSGARVVRAILLDTALRRQRRPAGKLAFDAAAVPKTVVAIMAIIPTYALRRTCVARKMEPPPVVMRPARITFILSV